MLKINNVSKTFNNSTVLDNINIQIEKSSIVGLAGASGGGKSTLLRCIQKLETIDSGIIECNGTIGFMFQDFQLFPHMTVLQNVVYAPALLDKTQNSMARAKVILENIGIAAKADEFPCNLSGGQKQRAALARSLMMHPDVLLCDEPTSGLDVATMLDVIALLKSIRDMGVTMIIASHDLAFLSKIADRVVHLENGKLLSPSI